MKPEFIDHIVIIISDIKKIEGFYSKFLGEAERLDEEQVCYKIGGTKLFFALPFGEYEKYDKNKTGLNHLAFGCRTIDELKKLEEKLNDGNIKNSGIKIDKYGKKEFIWFDDPDGTRLEFYLRSFNNQ